MKSFWQKYSYIMVKLFVTQCVISLFGNVLALFATSTDKLFIEILVGVISIIFYLFLLYTTIWDVGVKDKPQIDKGNIKYNKLTGFYIALGANIPNFILAAIYTAFLPFANSSEALSGVCAISKIISMFINGVYTSLMAVIKINGQPSHLFGLTFFIITIPSILLCTFGYILGKNEIHCTKLLLPVTPEELEEKQEKKRKRREGK